MSHIRCLRSARVRAISGVRGASGRRLGGAREASGRRPGGVREASGRCPRSVDFCYCWLLLAAGGVRIKKTAKPREAVRFFRPKLSDYHQFLTIFVAMRFRRQARWFCTILQKHRACAESSKTPRLCTKNGVGQSKSVRFVRVLGLNCAFSPCLCSKTV